jgi:ABC-type Mn2+/Zn2+ transport system ATPase subunit
VTLCRLLLDEPTNHLDAESVAWLEQHLDAYPGTVVAVTHDRYFLDNVAGWILELDRGHAYPYEGNYSTYLETKAARKRFGGRTLIDGLSLSLPPNGIVGVIGPNGVGKTALLQMILGADQPDAGTVRIGETVRISYVDQMRAGIDPDKTVWEVVSGGEAFIRAGLAEIPSRAYVAAFGFKGSDQQKPAGLMSGGERGRVNLALTLKQRGNLLRARQRPGRGDAGLTGGRAGRVSRLRRDHQPRPVVPGPGGHPHPGLGGRGELVLVRGQLRGLRAGQGRPARRGGGPPAPGHLPQADQVNARERSWTMTMPSK